MTHHGRVSDVPPEPAGEPAAEQTHVLPPDQPAAAPRPAFKDRLWSLRAVIAVALASVILGGLGGAALASVGHDHDRRGGPFQGRFGRGPMGPNQMGPGQQWQWNDGPRGTWPGRRGMGQRQWTQQGPGGQGGQLVPPSSGPTPTPPKASPRG